MSDFDLSEDGCPRCGHTPTHTRVCERCGGEGWIDPADDDPINYSAGLESWPCPVCGCSGRETWCPNCGHAMWHVDRVRATPVKPKEDA